MSTVVATSPTLSPFDNYYTHNWYSVYQSYGANEPGEWICECRDCGVQYLGDPAEFPDIAYPRCGEECP